MKLVKFTINICCGKTSTIYQTDQPITKKILDFLIESGFREFPHFTATGILYADNSDLIVTGPLGTDRLQVKCKKANCDQKLNDFEALLLKLE